MHVCSFSYQDYNIPNLGLNIDSVKYWPKWVKIRQVSEHIFLTFSGLQNLENRFLFALQVIVLAEIK
jgi:hypothetical protein